MEVLQNWITGICAVSILVAVARAITPKTAPAGAVRMIGGLLLVLAILLPLGKLDVAQLRFDNRRAEQALADQTARLSAENEKIREDIIAESLSAYIWKRAGCREGALRVRVRCENEIPTQVILYAAPEVNTARILKLIEEECGFSRAQVVLKSIEEDDTNAGYEKASGADPKK